MLWKPENPHNVMWDTWLLAQPQGGAAGGGAPPFYLNYLSSCDASCGGPTGGSWNGVGAATSVDGVHFADEGVVIHKDPGATWLGSGSVLRNAAGEYVMNFSQEYDCDKGGGRSCQSIFFATSPDLVAWTRVPDMRPGANDSAVFKYGKGYKVGGRWDCIATVPKPGAPGEFYGFWTATPAAPAAGGAGVGETTDASGAAWRALPPITAGFPTGAVGSVVVLRGRYFMLFGGGHLYTSRNATSGLVLDAVNPAVHAEGHGVAFSRMWNVAGDDELVLLTHQLVPTGSRADVWLGTVKRVVLGSDGTLRVHWWANNEALKGDALVLIAAGDATPATTAAAATATDPASVAMFVGTALQLGVGVVAEASVDCGGSAHAKGGLVAGAAAGNGTVFAWDCAAQLMEVGALSLGNGGAIEYAVLASWNRSTHFDYSGGGGAVTLRLLLRKPELSTGMGTSMMAEFYVNDVMAHPFVYTAVAGEAVYLGTASLPAGGGRTAAPVVADAKAWRMTLPYM